MVFLGELVWIQIFTPMSRDDGGYILIDTIIALLILSISLTSIYSLVTKSIKLEEKLILKMDQIIESGESYDETLKKTIK